MATIVNARDVILQAATARVAGVTMSQNLIVDPTQVTGLGLIVSGTKAVQLQPSEQVFQAPLSGSPNPSQISLVARSSNVTGTPSLSVVSGTISPTPTLVGGVATILYSHLTTTSATIRLSLTDGGVTYTDDVTIIKAVEGASGLLGYLTEETLLLPADSLGNVTNYAGAAGNFKVYSGQTDISSLCTYNVQTNASSLAVSINATTGAYVVTGAFPTGSSTASVTFRATFGGSTYDKTITLTKTTSTYQGLDGTSGLNNATVFLYKRSASAPAVPSTTATYTFSTGVLTGHNNSWTQTIPSGTDPVYATVATASSSGTTDTIATNEWAAPVVLAQNGTDGANVASVFIYRRATSAPAVPSATATYTFATGAITGLNNSWTATVPTGTDPLYVATATAFSTGTTDTIPTGEWATPRILAQNGTNGSNGTNGIRGSRTFYVTLSGATNTYSDSLATTTASVDGGPVLNDVVTQSNASQGFSQTKFWSGTAWVIVNAVVDGNLLVNGTVGAVALAANSVTTSALVADSVTSTKVDSRNLTIKDAAGNVIFGASQNLDINRLAQQSDYAPYLAWDFNGSTQSWVAVNATLTSYSDSMGLSATTTDPELISPALSLNGEFYGKVRMRVRRDAGTGWQGTLYYSTGGHGSSESYKKTIANATVTGQWVILEWDMHNLTAGGSDWSSNTITAVRFDLGNTTSDQFTIDWISIGRSGPFRIASTNVSTFMDNAAINLAQINTASIGTLSALTANVGLLRTASSGSRVEIESNEIRVYDSGTLRIQIGDLA